MAQKRNFDTLQAGRAFAALLVVLYHASSTIFQNPKFWPQTVFGGFFNFGHAGVHFFFVLSGFIILSAHVDDIGKPERLANYVWRRFSRVYPVYWVVLLPIVAVYLFFPNISKPELSSPAIIENSFLLVGLHNHASLAVAWTLFHEILFYALFALCIVSRSFGIAVMVAWLWLCFALKIFGFDPTYHLAGINLLFGLGMLTFYLVDRKMVAKPLVWASAGVSTFLIAGVIEVTTGWGDALVYGVAAASAVAGFAALEQVRTIKVPSDLKLLGDASYSIYLVHYPALSILARVSRGSLSHFPAEIAFLVIVAGTVAICVAFYLMVEMPINKLLRRVDFFRNASVSRAKNV